MSDQKSIGIMLCGHGSRDQGAVDQFAALAVALQERLPDYPLESGYLEFARPVIREGLEALRARGARRILALPGMLFAGTHVKNDLPWEINSFAAAHADVSVTLGRDLGMDAGLLKAAADRITEAEAASAQQISRADTLLVVVGRGTTDPDANSNISKIARMLWEGMGFGWAEVAYSGTAHPRVEACLKRISRLGYKRVIVFPYFMFTGILVNRIYEETRRVASSYPEIEFLEASYFGNHPLLVESFVERFRALLGEETWPSCQLCKYRVQIVGYEEALGQVQKGHHHHVSGIGTDADHHHEHANRHDHGHSHGEGHPHHHHDH